jgi:hypothetical protein
VEGLAVLGDVPSTEDSDRDREDHRCVDPEEQTGRGFRVPQVSHFVWADDVDLRKGRTNKLGYTIWMPELDTENVMRIPSHDAQDRLHDPDP